MTTDRRNKRWLILAFLFVACIVLAQRMISLRKISVNDGLAQSSIACMLQDSKGYIWIATNDGLNRYDGYEFLTFRPDSRNPDGISASQIGYLLEDQSNRIWMNTNLGLECYDQRTRRFTHYHSDINDTTKLTPGQALSMCIDDSGRIWVTTEKIIDVLDPRSGKIRHLRSDLTNAASQEPVKFAGVANCGNQILAGTDHGLYYINGLNYSFQRIADTIQHCYRIIDNGNSGINIFADSSSYLFYRNEASIKLIAKGFVQTSTYAYPSYLVTSSAWDDSGIMWTGGWMRLTPLKITEEKTTIEDYYTNGMVLNASSALCIDHSQNIWVGGEGSELLSGSLNNSHFLSYKLMHPGQSIHANNSVWSADEDTSGCFWIGAQSSIHKLNPKTGEVITFRSNDNVASPIADNRSFVTLCDSKGNVWIDAGFTLNLYDPATGGFKKFPHVPGDSTTHPPRNFSCAMESRSGELYFGTYGYCVTKFNPSTGEFTPYRQSRGTPFAPSTTLVRSLFEDRDGNIWVGTGKGVDLLDPKTGHYFPKLDSSGYISQYHGISQTEDGYLWLGSNHYGLLKYNIGKNLVEKVYTTEDGLSNNNIYDVVADNDGMLWISTNVGISRFDPSTESFRNYDHSDGIQNNEFSGGAGKMTSSGWILMGCADGLTAFHPEQMDINPYEPKVEITDFRLFNKEVGIDSGVFNGPDSSVFQISYYGEKPCLPIDISFVSNIELDYDQNFLEFEYVGLHYLNSEKNTYAYMLEGVEAEWNYVGDKRSASYTNLSPGEYTFKVKAANCDGIWNEVGRSIHIVINPPWWETLWFRTLAIIAGISALVVFFQYRTAALRKRQKELERTVQERTADVVAQKHIVEEKQKEIIDSINYAERIQRALLASDKLLRDNLGEHFVLFKPKDIVAGDFYWGTVVPDGFILITADCTGHGVPGAFMSLLNISKLSETIAEKKITRPDLVLNNVRSEIIRSLNPNAGDNSQDGMDCILCKFDLKNKKLEYAAANNGFYVVRNGELITCGADKMPVGKSHDDNTAFTLHTVQLQSGDVVYTLTDGYPDQFGGPKGKKFKYKQLEEMLVQLSGLPMEHQKKKLDAALEDWRGNLEQVDDICIIGVKVP